MKISSKGLDLIKEYEGLRLKAYKCPAGIPTIGYGHTDSVTMDMLITKEQADLFLQEDVSGTEDAVYDLCAFPPTQHQFDAMVCLAFNIGTGAFAKSTVLKKFNAGDVLGASKAFTLWNKATVGGEKRELPGLTRRRQAEAALFLEGGETFVPEPLPQTGAIEERVPKPLMSSRTGQTQAAGMGLGGAAVALGLVEQFSDKLPQLEALVAFVRHNSGTVILIVGAAAVLAAGYAIIRQIQHGGRS